MSLTALPVYDFRPDHPARASSSSPDHRGEFEVPSDQQLTSRMISFLWMRPSTACEQHGHPRIVTNFRPLMVARLRRARSPGVAPGSGG